MMDSCSLNFPGGQTISFDHPPKFHIPRFLKGTGIQAYEPISQATFLAAIESRPGPVFDIGSNIGIYSIVVATALGRTVYAFEPFEEAANVLRRIVDDYSLPIHVIDAAVSNAVGEQNFFLSTKSDMSNSLNEAFRQHRGVRVVRCVTVDGEAETRHPCAIKIDTETTEMDVLEGSIDTLQQDQPAILIEILGEQLGHQVKSFLEPWRYTILELGSSTFQTVLGDISDLDTSGDKRNWLALPASIPVDDQFLSRTQSWIDVLRKCAITA